jgi:hypothetical protein
MAGLLIDDPISLTNALASKNILPGDTLWLRAGTYTIGDGKGQYIVSLQGTEANPITIRNYPHEHVRINGGFWGQFGTNVIFRGLEIAPTPTGRYFSGRGGLNVDYPAPIRLYGGAYKVINCVLHDGLQGLEVFGSGPTTLYGNMVYNNGWYYSENPVEQTGYGIYTHNDPALRIDIKHNIFAQGYGVWGIHCNATSNKVKNYHIVQNVVRHGVVFSSASVIDECYLDENHLTPGGFRAGASGYGHDVNVYISATNNRIYCEGIAGNMGNGRMETLVFTGNKLVGEAFLVENSETAEGVDPTVGPWDTNSYYTTNVTDATIRLTPFYQDGAVAPRKNLADWRTFTGYDLNSTLAEGMPAANEIFYYPNEYKDADDDREGIIVVWNWTQADSVSLDLSSFNLTIDENYKLMQSQDPYGDVIPFTYTGANVTVDMRVASRSVATATAGLIQPTNKSSDFAGNFTHSINAFPIFGAFVLEKA